MSYFDYIVVERRGYLQIELLKDQLYQFEACCAKQTSSMGDCYNKLNVLFEQITHFWGEGLLISNDLDRVTNADNYMDA